MMLYNGQYVLLFKAQPANDLICNSSDGSLRSSAETLVDASFFEQGLGLDNEVSESQDN